MIETPAANQSAYHLMKLKNTELRLLLKRMKITGWSSSPKGSMVGEIVRRSELRERFKQLTRK